jgi:D-beta-D-heptose 7-phosphate kinase/D-beta-D-heptose 1-phosphate adenosyltransferase
MTLSELQHLLECAARRRVLCVGDLMVDRFVYGAVGRISPEAPIPVLLRSEEAVMLGAAGNVARNVAALNVPTVLVGVVGDDGEADVAAGLSGREPRLDAHLITAKGRRTTVKTRFVAAGQQLLRVDSEDVDALADGATDALQRAAAEAGRDAGAILISDYAKGVVTPGLIEVCLQLGAQTGAPVIVDPKTRNLAKYGPVDLIKPNAKELALATEMATGSDAEVEAALAAALDGCSAKAILVTRAGQGMSLAVRGRAVEHFRARARAVFDVSGAGDTCLATLGAMLAAGAPLSTAAEVAVLASGVAVGKLGTAVVTPAELVEAELLAHLAPAEAKVTTLDGAASKVAAWRRQGLKIGFTNGCFDILHRGHVSYLKAARSECDRLIVGLNTDSSIRALKGPDRPVNDLEARAMVLAGLASTDLVVPFDAPTPIALIEEIRPDLLLKGADYKLEAVVGAELVLAYGGEVRLVPLVAGHSTTAVIQRLRSTPREEILA